MTPNAIGDPGLEIWKSLDADPILNSSIILMLNLPNSIDVFNLLESGSADVTVRCADGL